MAKRPPLNRKAIIEAAATVADKGGIAKLSMRNVARELDCEAMSLYHHVANKDALVDALVDWFFQQVELPELAAPWRRGMTQRAHSARQALLRHPWALGLIESRRAPGPALLTHHDRILGNLRANGFSVALAAHAFSAIDAYVYGFVLTELNLPFEAGESTEEFVGAVEGFLDPQAYPHMIEMIAVQVSGKEYAYANEFDFGLDLILDSLAIHLSTDAA